MKAVLISIQPKWCELIANGKKTIEVRKTRPKIETPFKCYIYCTEKALLTKSHCDGHIYVAPKKKYKKALENAGNITLSGKVIGEFVCDRIYEYNTSWLDGEDRLLETTCLDDSEIMDYMNGYLDKRFCGWHISDLKIYDKSKKISEFRKPCPYGDLPCWSCPSCDKDENDNLIQCFNTVSRPPQSWCYVEG